VPAAREARIQPGIEDHHGLLFSKNARAHGQHIEVIVLSDIRASYSLVMLAARIPGVLLALLPCQCRCKDRERRAAPRPRQHAGNRVSKVRVVARDAGEVPQSSTHSPDAPSELSFSFSS